MSEEINKYPEGMDGAIKLIAKLMDENATHKTDDQPMNAAVAMSEEMPDEAWIGKTPATTHDTFRLYAFIERQPYLTKYIPFDKHQAELAAYKAAVRDMAWALKIAKHIADLEGSPFEEKLYEDVLLEHAALIEAEGK